MRVRIALAAGFVFCCAMYVVSLWSILGRYGAYDPAAAGASMFFLTVAAVPLQAAMFSLFTNGTDRWVRRLAFYFLVAAAGLLCLFAVLSAAGAIWYVTGRSWIAILVACCVTVWILRRAWKISGRRAIALETQNRLRARQAGVSIAELRRYGRIGRILICIPVSAVLFCFMFLPETWGLASHLVHRRTISIGSHHVHTPLTSIIRWNYPDSTWVFIAKGPARSPKRWMHSPETNRMLLTSIPLSHVSFYQRSEPSDYDDHIRSLGQVLERREVLTGGEVFTCLRHQRSWIDRNDGSLVFVDCSTKEGFDAHFSGNAEDLPEFYKILSQIER